MQVAIIIILTESFFFCVIIACVILVRIIMIATPKTRAAVFDKFDKDIGGMIMEYFKATTREPVDCIRAGEFESCEDYIGTLYVGDIVNNSMIKYPAQAKLGWIYGWPIDELNYLSIACSIGDVDMTDFLVRHGANFCNRRCKKSIGAHLKPAPAGVSLSDWHVILNRRDFEEIGRSANNEPQLRPVESIYNGVYIANPNSRFLMRRFKI